MPVETTPPARGLLTDDTRSRASRCPAVPSRAKRRAGSAGNAAAALMPRSPAEHRAVPLAPPLTDGELDDVSYTEPGPSVAGGFSEPAREPGPEAPSAADDIEAEDEAATAAEAFVGMPLAEVERLVIEATIRACGDSLPQAARILGVSPSTLYRKRAGWTDRSGGV